MKKLTILFMMYVLMTSCKDAARKDEIKSFIPGVYVTRIEGEFSKGFDTLTLACISKDGNSYRISRRISFHRVLDGKTFAAEVKAEEYTGIYDAKDRVINETRKGKVFSFNPQENTMLMGASVYRKIE